QHKVRLNGRISGRRLAAAARGLGRMAGIPRCRTPSVPPQKPPAGADRLPGPSRTPPRARSAAPPERPDALTPPAGELPTVQFPNDDNHPAPAQPGDGAEAHLETLTAAPAGAEEGDR